MLISESEMKDLLHRLFTKYGFNDEKAKVLADTHTENTLAGVNSHGINRVASFLHLVSEGIVKTDQEAIKLNAFGSIEQWDGQFGPGVINARKCTNRAIELAKSDGMGLVALKNTNHWMRGGAYGWQAAEAGCIAIMFTNTKPNMPPWGGKESRIGNNPFIIAIPRNKGHVVLDMAISQYSFGKINEYRLRGEKLPYPGGWDVNNELSNDPEKILQKERGLPIGYWKGSALSMILDMLATLLSAGKSTSKIGEQEHETGLSQVFLCIYPALFQDPNISEKLINEIIDYSRTSSPTNLGSQILYPGERTLRAIKSNREKGMKVNKEVWNEILSLLQY